MKKSKLVLLGTVFLAGITSCQNENDQWIAGDAKSKDTIINRHIYRSYGTHWYPVMNGMINPYRYNGSSAVEVSKPTYHPSLSRSFTSSHSSGVHVGGFGHSAHISAGS